MAFFYKKGIFIGVMNLMFLFSLSLEARMDSVPGSRYTAVRAAGLADAFLPLVDDGGEALFYNPALIGHLKRTHLELFNLQILGNSNFLNDLNLSSYKVVKLESFKSELQENTGKNLGAGISLFPNFFFRGFAAGVFLQSRVIAKHSGDEIEYRSLYEVIPAVGGAIRLARGIVKLGYSLHWVNQAYGQATVSQDSSSLGYENGIYKGSGMSHNFGFSLTLPYNHLPAFNLVARNIGGVSYTTSSLVPFGENTAGAPPDEESSFDASFSFQSKIGKGGYYNFVLQARDLTNRSNMPWGVRAAFGFEVSFRDNLFFRVGYGSGYPSAGIALRRKKSEFSLSWYSEELGTAIDRNRNINILLQYQLRVF